MLTFSRNAAYLAAAALTAGAAIFLPVLAATEKMDAVHGFPPKQAFSQTLGSKQAMGYFMEHNGRCLVTFMVAEAFDEMSDQLPPSAARFTTTIEPTQSAMVESAESLNLMVTCGPNGKTVSIETNAKPVM